MRPLLCGLRAPFVVAALLVAGTACDPPPPGTQARGTFAPLTPLDQGAAAVRVDLTHVACGTPAFCVAVPASSQGNPPQSLWGEAWDGTRWSPVPTPGISVAHLACAGPWCLALSGPAVRPGDLVGASAWDGRGWTRITAPDGLSPSDLTCWSRDACLAVGRIAEQPVAMRWDGAAWNPVHGSRTTPGAFAEVDCRSADDCWFVTTGTDGTRSVERLHDGVWSVVPVGVPAQDLTCATTREMCVMVWYSDGGERSHLQAVRGPSWEPEEVPIGDTGVLGVDCGTDGCVVTTATATLVYDGTGPPTTLPGRGTDPNHYIPITCPTTSFCAYLAENLYPTFRDTRRPPVIPTWDGRSWTNSTATPNPTEPRAVLTSVSCSASDECLAVGHAIDGTRLVGLAQRWDGRQWTLAPAPPAPAGRHLDVRTVSCSTRDHCVAVGSTMAEEENPPLYEHLYGNVYLARFDGRTWTDETALLPVGPVPYVALTDVDCTGATCIAVGSPTEEPAPGSPVTASAFVSPGPGSGWAKMAGPPVGGSSVMGGLPGRYLAQIDCASPTSCASTSLFAVFGLASLTSYWNGTRWTAAPAPGEQTPTLGGTVVQGVSCPGPGRCFAPGFIQDPSTPGGRGSVLRWTGTAWTATTLAVGGLGLTSCGTAERCLAIDSLLYGPADLRDSAVREVTGWRRVPGAGLPPHLTNGSLNDVSCTPTMCLVVGFDGQKPVAYRWLF